MVFFGQYRHQQYKKTCLVHIFPFYHLKHLCNCKHSSHSFPAARRCLKSEEKQEAYHFTEKNCKADDFTFFLTISLT